VLTVRRLGLGATIAIALLATPLAADAATWARISDASDGSNQPYASMVRSGDQVIAAFDRAASAGSETATFTPSVTAGATGITHANATPGWAQALDHPQLFPRPGGGFQMIVSGSHSTTTGDPLNGSVLFPVSATGVPGAVAVTGVEDDITGAVLGPDGQTAFWVGNSAGALNVYRGLSTPTVHHLALPGGAGADAYEPKIGVDNAGRIWITWYELPPGAFPNYAGLWLQQIDPATGDVLGSPALAPHSATISNNWPALACFATCRIVYHLTSANGITASGSLVSWAAGETRATTVATPGKALISGNSSTGASYDAAGHLWVAWYQGGDSPSYRAKRGDAAGAGGITQNLRAPANPHNLGGGGYRVSALAFGGRLVVAINWFQSTASNIWVATAEDPDSLTFGIPNAVVIDDPAGHAAVPGKVTGATLGAGRCLPVRVQAPAAATLSVELRTGVSGARGVVVGKRAKVTFAGPGIRTLCVRLAPEPRGFYAKGRPFHWLFTVHLPGRKADTRHSLRVGVVVRS
jgi:hypothetical protein